MEQIFPLLLSKTVRHKTRVDKYLYDYHPPLIRRVCAAVFHGRSGLTKVCPSNLESSLLHSLLSDRETPLSVVWCLNIAFEMYTMLHVVAVT